MTKKLKEQLDVEIKRFLENIENQSNRDRLETLNNMFEKYLHLNTCDYMMDRFDLMEIIGSAKSNFSTTTFPIFLGHKKHKVDPNDHANLCIIEATIGHLNKNGCLKKMAKFDKREDLYDQD